MKRSALFIAALLLVATAALAGQPRTYQVTGPVLEVKSDSITVQKDTEKWEIAVDKGCKGNMPKVGDKVTVKYQMKAVAIEKK
jgi:hypothetical protein